jgi:hypothetical protein
MESSENKIPFSNLPTNLGNHKDDFHIPSTPTTTANLAKFKTERTFPTSPLLRSLQAHPSIGKDCGTVPLTSVVVPAL